MSRGINKAIIIGNICQDIELKVGTSGGSIANLSIATNESWLDKNTKQKMEKTEFHRVVLFNRLAEIAQEYLKKGSKVYIEGKLQTRKWQDQSGADRYTTEIVAFEMQMLDSRGDGQDRPQQAPQAQAAPSQAAPMDDFPDDVPF